MGAIGRPILLVCGLTAFLLLVAVACIGGDDDDQPSGINRDNVDVVMSTFTPTSEADAANRQATQDAQETAVAATATYAFENPPPPPPTRDPNATMAPQPTLDPEAEGFRPPFTWLSDGVNMMYGVFGSYGMIDEVNQSYANVAAPFYDVGDDGLTVAPGSELEFILQEDVDPPTSMSVKIYTWADNSAIPTGTDGSIGDRLWFVPGAEPVSTTAIELDDMSFNMPGAPDRYVVLVELRWPHDERLPDPNQMPLFATYAFNIYVQ